MDAFDTAMARAAVFEGGYVNDPHDAGGETRYGISKRSYPDVDIKALTFDAAREIYRRDFWVKPRLDQLPDRLAIAVFDGAVNSGARASVGWLQRSLGVADDSVIGPATVAAARSCDPSATLMRYLGCRLAYMADCATWASHGRGWARRIARALQEG